MVYYEQPKGLRRICIARSGRHISIAQGVDNLGPVVFYERREVEQMVAGLQQYLKDTVNLEQVRS